MLRGYPDGTFRPGATITRAEFATIAVRFMFSGDVEAAANALDGSFFNDIDGHWAEAYIKVAAQLGLVGGYDDGSFRPNAPITRAEVATILNNSLNRVVESEEDLLDGMTIFADNQPGTWFYLAIQEATHSTFYERKEDGIHKVWVEIRPNPDWDLLNRPNARSEDVSY